jgi:hypothetical protein
MAADSGISTFLKNHIATFYGVSVSKSWKCPLKPLKKVAMTFFKNVIMLLSVAMFVHILSFANLHPFMEGGGALDIFGGYLLCLFKKVVTQPLF